MVAAVFAGNQLAAQSWNDSRVAVDTCARELEFRMGRDAGGRAPTAGIDFQTLQVRQAGRNSLAVTGRGSFRRDQFDRGRAYTFACTYDTAGGRTSVTYSWTGAASGGGRNTGRFAHEESWIFEALSPELPKVDPRSWMSAAGVRQAVAPERIEPGPPPRLVGAVGQFWQVTVIG